MNGTTTTTSYDAANQVVGWTYDAAGNVVSDGVATATFDALSRPITITAGLLQREAAYNGDGVLVEYTEDGVTSQLAQDLAAPLSQVLRATQGMTTAIYLYGQTHLATVTSGVRSWELGDALGSVRMTLDDTGAALGSVGYDPWGAPQAPLGPPHAGEMSCSAPSASPANCRTA
ncbi:MAG: hypothetical protein MI924_33565, partial [Chloroflexales bacterium]|nr:hypothetical protein [Chloroflexales bacterium]